MKQVRADLWQTEVESPAPGLTTHAYLLSGDDGNVLFYNTAHSHELDHMARLGGVRYQYLSHRDELGDSLNVIRERFGAKLGGHVRERDDFARVCPPDVLFDRREVHFGKIEVIPTPGHTPGSVCFYVTSVSGERYLFTGDTLYLGKDGVWKAGLLPFSDRIELIKSLSVLQDLEPTLVLSSAFAAEPGYEAVVPDRWGAMVETIKAELSKA